MSDLIKYYLLFGFMMVFLILTTSGYSKISEFVKLEKNFKQNILDIEYIFKNFIEFLVFVSIAIFWPIYIFIQIYNFFYEKRLKKISRQNWYRFELKMSDLIERVPKAEIEKREIVYDPLGAAPSIPFGHLNFAWIEFCSQLDPIDEIWSFDLFWDAPWGDQEHYSGYAAVRNDDIINIFHMR